tara:strand:- start:77 stop:226 length:150 start_codon:yes stop_codon:yes gene_type:complete
MIISAILFLGGAVGVEMITGYFIEKSALLTTEQIHNSNSIFLLYSLEET